MTAETGAASLGVGAVVLFIAVLLNGGNSGAPSQASTSPSTSEASPTGAASTTPVSGNVPPPIGGDSESRGSIKASMGRTYERFGDDQGDDAGGVGIASWNDVPYAELAPEPKALMLQTYYAKVRQPDGSVMTLDVQARDPESARRVLHDFRGNPEVLAGPNTEPEW